MSLIKRISTVGGLTMVSRIFGLVREILMARYLGAGMAADAFFIAFKLPNFFRRLFAEGAFSAAFVPLFSRLLGNNPSEEDNAKAILFAEQVFSIFLPVLFIFLVMMEWGMAEVMITLTGGFDGNDVKFDLTTLLGRLTFPYLMLISLVSLWAGMLNAFGRFSAAALAPVILNIFMISALLFIGETRPEKAIALAAAVSLSGIAQFLWLVITARRAGIRLRIMRPRLTPQVKELLKIIGPAALGAGVMQLNLLIDIILAARFLPEGSVSWLFYADRLNQLPIGLVGVAIGTVLLPSISRALGSGDTGDASDQQNKAFEFALLLTLPAAFALAIIPIELISTLFERGNFTASDTTAVAFALTAYAFGLPAYVLTKVLMPGYFARKDTKTPVKIGIITLLINTILNLALIGPFGHVGLALGTAFAAWVNVGLLYAGLKRRGHFTLYDETRAKAFRALLAASIMGIAIYWAAEYLHPYLRAGSTSQILALTALILIGVFVYFGAAILFKAANIKSLKNLRRKT